MKNLAIKLQNIKLDKLALFVFCAWIVLQIIAVICYWNYPQYPDVHHYMEEAISHLQRGELYPSEIDLQDRWIQSPGNANYLLLILAIFGTFKPIMIINIIMNAAIVVEMFYFAKTFFNKNTAYISIILYCGLLISNIFLPIHMLSEIPFLFLCMTALCLGLSSKWYWLLCSGFVFFLALTFRPQMAAFLVPLMLYYVLNKRQIKVYLLLLLPFALSIALFGEYNKNKTGYFLVNSTTGGQCLAGVANDDASLKGGEAEAFDLGGAAYIENELSKTFHEKDSIWKAMAVEWIKEHPVRYSIGVCVRACYLFVYDFWAFPLQDHIKPELRTHEVTASRLNYVLLSIPFYILVLITLFSLWFNRRDILTKKGLVFLIIIFFVGGSSLVHVETRFHYPFVWALCIWAAYGIEKKFHTMKA